MKRKGLVTIFAVAAVIFAVVNFVSGISGLVRSGAELSKLSAVTEKGSICEVNVTFAKEMYTVKHKLFLIIPFGTEHYYFGYDDSADPVPMLIKASRSWFSRNFTETGLARNGSVTVKGEVCKFGTLNSKKVTEVNSELSGIDKRVSISVYSYLNSQNITHHIHQLVSGAMPLVLIGALAALLLMKEHSERRIIVVTVVLLISVVGFIVSSIALKAV